MNVWDDKKIDVGTNWKEAINSAIREASVAVLLVSKEFFASTFVMEQELPRIIKKAKNRELRIIWIAVGYSAYELSPLFSFQAANNAKKPLDSLSKPDRDKSLVDVARKISDSLTISNLASGLDLIDETTEPFEAAFERRPERADRSFDVEAVYEPATDLIKLTGTYTTITAKDIKMLSADDQEYIADLEDGMTKHYGSWRKVKRKLGDGGGALDDDIRKELLRIASLMCDDLNNILKFLRDIHKAELDDHYGRYRDICSQIG